MAVDLAKCVTHCGSVSSKRVWLAVWYVCVSVWRRAKTVPERSEERIIFGFSEELSRAEIGDEEMREGWVDDNGT